MTHAKRLLKIWVWALSLWIAVAVCAAQQKVSIQSSSPAPPSDGSSSVNTQLEVAPGTPLPAKGMVWILDQTENHPHLERIYVNDAHVNRHLAENVVRTQLLVLRMSSSIELSGTAAKLRVSSKTPAIFVHKSEEDEEESQSPVHARGFQSHYALLHLRVADDRRVVCTFTAWQLGLKSGRHEDVVEASTEELAAGQWLKITPRQALPEGEFVVTRLPDNKKLFESHVYDFGIGTTTKQPTTQ